MDPTLAPQVTPVGPSDDRDSPSIVIAYINCVGQTKLPISKQREIQSFVCSNKIDILHLQECRMDNDSFSQCGFLTSNYNLFSNNKPDESHYGTASLVRSDIKVQINIPTTTAGSSSSTLQVAPGAICISRPARMGIPGPKGKTTSVK